jgi:hypothetical protein
MCISEIQLVTVNRFILKLKINLVSFKNIKPPGRKIRSDKSLRVSRMKISNAWN